MNEWRFTTKVYEENGEGRFKVPPQFRDAFQHWLKTRGDKSNGYFELILVPPRKRISTGKRSLLNRIFGHIRWVMICMYSQGHEWDLSVWEYFFKSRAVRGGFPADRIPGENGEEILVPKSLGDESVSMEHGLLVSGEIERFASENSIVLPEYDDKGHIVFV